MKTKNKEVEMKKAGMAIVMLATVAMLAGCDKTKNPVDPNQGNVYSMTPLSGGNRTVTMGHNTMYLSYGRYTGTYQINRSQ